MWREWVQKRCSWCRAPQSCSSNFWLKNLPKLPLKRNGRPWIWNTWEWPLRGTSQPGIFSSTIFRRRLGPPNPTGLLSPLFGQNLMHRRLVLVASISFSESQCLKTQPKFNRLKIQPKPNRLKFLPKLKRPKYLLKLNRLKFLLRLNRRKFHLKFNRQYR